MKEEEYLHSLQDLKGKVAIVTGGGEGIGFQTTLYLAKKGAIVYVAARNDPETEAGIKAARRKIQADAGTAEPTIRHHYLDLGTIQGAWISAEEFKKRESRLDIIICNAGIAMAPQNELSADGFERHLAVNHLGHFSFVTCLLDLIKNTADAAHQDGRIVFTASRGYMVAEKIDYDILVTKIPEDGKKLRDVKHAFQLYVNSKLALIYGVQELARRVRKIGIKNVYINSCHPGNAVRTRMGKNFQSGVGPLLEKFIRALLSIAIGNRLEDCAKTQVYVSANPTVQSKDLSGLYWEPRWSFARTYRGCKPTELTELGRDPEEVKKMWNFTISALQKALSPEQFEFETLTQLRNV